MVGGAAHERAVYGWPEEGYQGSTNGGRWRSKREGRRDRIGRRRRGEGTRARWDGGGGGCGRAHGVEKEEEQGEKHKQVEEEEEHRKMMRAWRTRSWRKQTRGVWKWGRRKSTRLRKRGAGGNSRGGRRTNNDDDSNSSKRNKTKRNSKNSMGPGFRP